MQLYVAYKMKKNRFFGNFSGTGSGKTLSAILSSRTIGSKLTLIICPKDVINQWKKNIFEVFPDFCVVTHKEAFYALNDGKKYQYLIPNYDQFSLEETPNLILNLTKQQIDFVVLDEIHFVKKRDE
jgi:superfamily II DNA or RNA helicase